jgi:hypothetical protein
MWRAVKKRYVFAPPPEQNGRTAKSLMIIQDNMNLGEGDQYGIYRLCFYVSAQKAGLSGDPGYQGIAAANC